MLGWDLIQWLSMCLPGEEKVPVNSSTSSIHSAAGHSKKFHSIHPYNTVLHSRGRRRRPHREVRPWQNAGKSAFREESSQKVSPSQWPQISFVRASRYWVALPLEVNFQYVIYLCSKLGLPITLVLNFCQPDLMLHKITDVFAKNLKSATQKTEKCTWTNT